METPPEPGNQRPGSRNKGKLELPHRFYIKGVENRDKDISSIVHLPGLQAKQLPASLGKPEKRRHSRTKSNGSGGRLGSIAGSGAMLNHLLERLSHLYLVGAGCEILVL